MRLLASLSEQADISVALLNPTDDPAPLAEALGVRDITALRRWPSAAVKRGTALAHRWPLPAAAVYDRRIAAWVREAAGGDGAGRRAAGGRATGGRATGGRAIVVADHVQAAPYLQGAPRSVLSLQNADAALHRDQPWPAQPVRRIEHGWDRVTLSRLERRALRDADVVVCVSEQDRSILRCPTAVVVPNGADLPGAVTPVPRAGAIVFVGSLNYAPNAEAVRWWLREIGPLLPADLPALTVVGRAARAVLGDPPGLQVVSDVPDVAPYLEQASVVVVPLLSGGGSRLKLIEAMARGRPVVSTSKGAEGFPVQHERELMLADGPQAIAEAVTRVYRDPVLAQRLASAGRAFAEAYSWDALGDRFTAAVLEPARQPT